MAALELIKENIEYEQLLGENFADTVIKGEYLIPDTHPDVAEILMVDVKPSITTKETMQDKVYLEGQVEYNVIYLAKEEEGMGVYNVTYNDKFSNYIDIQGTEHKMICDGECHIEHIDSTIINERKVGMSGIIKLKSSVYKNFSFEVVKGMAKEEELQMLKHPTIVDKVLGNVNGDMVVKSQIKVPMDKPQIGKVLKCDVMLHKKEAKLMMDKVQVAAFAQVKLLYRGADSKELVCLYDDVFISKEIDMEGADTSMGVLADFKVDALDYNLKDDDLGEIRIVDLEAIVNSSVKVVYKDHIDMIEDAYSPKVMMDMVRKNYNLNVLQGSGTGEAIVKENIEVDNAVKPLAIVMANGNAMITDKRLVENKVVLDGIVKVDVLFKTDNEEMYLSKISEELPFSCSVDIDGAKIDMQSIAKISLEGIEASVEANTIAVKAVVMVQARVNYITSKEFLIDILASEEEVPKKKASITIYVVQPDDTLWKIAKKYYTTVDEIAKINGIDNSSVVNLGDKLLIPGRVII